ncbi:unnamed protein product, partial [Ectocarpus sp. 12 AP-2014]
VFGCTSRGHAVIFCSIFLSSAALAILSRREGLNRQPSSSILNTSLVWTHATTVIHVDKKKGRAYHSSCGYHEKETNIVRMLRGVIETLGRPQCGHSVPLV